MNYKKAKQALKDGAFLEESYTNSMDLNPIFNLRFTFQDIERVRFETGLKLIEELGLSETTAESPSFGQIRIWKLL